MYHVIWVTLIKTMSHHIVIHKVEMMSFALLGSLPTGLSLDLLSLDSLLEKQTLLVLAGLGHKTGQPAAYKTQA